MDLSIRALVVLLVAFGAVFFSVRTSFRDSIGGARLTVWMTLVFGATVIVFLSPDFWVAMILSGILILLLGRGEKFYPAIYLLLLLCLPPLGRIISLGPINSLIELKPAVLLSVLILIPSMFIGVRMRKSAPIGSLTDLFFVLFFGLSVILGFRDENLTTGLRGSVTILITLAAPYVVFSRWPKSLEDGRVMALAFAIPLLTLGGLAILETLRHWHFYGHIPGQWGAGTQTSLYSQRSGYLRAYGSTFAPIFFGSAVTLAIILTLPLLSLVKRGKFMFYGVLFAAVIGVLSTLSRGAWVGLAGAGVLYILTGQKAVQRLFKFGGVAIVGMIAGLFSPFGRTIADLLPFIGGRDQETIDYRFDLLNISLEVLSEKPLFGGIDVYEHPKMQVLIQGQGIIDVVNSYLQIAFEVGYVGLAFYLGAHLCALSMIWSAFKKARSVAPELAELCRGVFVALAALMAMMAITSSSAQTEQIDWFLTGFAVAMARVVRARELSVEGLAPAAAPVDPAVEESVEPASKKYPAPTALPVHLRQYVRRET